MFSLKSFLKIFLKNIIVKKNYDKIAIVPVILKMEIMSPLMPVSSKEY